MKDIPAETARFPRRAYELPLLRAIVELGGEVAPSDALYSSVAEKMGFTVDQGDYDVAHAKPKWVYELQWVRWHLTKSGELDGTKRGIWGVTEAGRQRVETEWASYSSEQYRITDNSRQEVADVDWVSGELSRSVSGFYDQLRATVETIQLEDIVNGINPYTLCLAERPSAVDLIPRLLDEYIVSSTEMAFNDMIVKPVSRQLGQPELIMGLICKMQSVFGVGFGDTRARAINRLLREFYNRFLSDDYSLAFGKLAEFIEAGKGEDFR